MAEKPYILGICGGSGSGKTFLLRQLRDRFSQEQLMVLSQDNYYKKLEEQDRDEEGLVNFDHPNSIRLDRLQADLTKLIRGESFEQQEYTFNNPEASAKTLTISPAPIILLEGLFIYHLPETRKLIDLKLFVEADEHTRLARRLQRDTTERGYHMDEILRDYRKFVAPMYDTYVLPTRQYCDMVIINNGTDPLEKVVSVICSHLHAALRKMNKK